MRRKMQNKKGFTLMEMLIVIAIIGILAAIAIPTFSGALNKARVAADTAAVRAYYADCLTKHMLEEEPFPVGEDYEGGGRGPAYFLEDAGKLSFPENLYWEYIVSENRIVVTYVDLNGEDVLHLENTEVPVFPGTGN